MTIFTPRSTLTGIGMALLLVFGTLANSALADHGSHRYGHGQQQRYFHHDQKPRHHNGNRGGWHPGWQHSYSYQHRHRFQQRNRPHHRHHRGYRYGQRHGHGHRYGRYRDHGRHYNHRGHVHYRGSDLIGALVGGAIIYHLGRELSRH